MAVSSIKDFWIHPNALTITLNYFGDPQLIQTSMLAGAVIMAYRKDVISYDAAHNYREWKLQAFPTQLNDTCAYYVHAELSRSGDTAMIIYSPVKRDIEGRTLLRVEKDENGRDVDVWDETTSTESYFIYLGTISASVDNDGSTVERAWTDGFYTGTLDTDQQRMEEASGEWKTMFNYNAVTDQIEPLKPFSKIKVMGEAIFQSIAQFVNGIVIGKRTITDVAASSDSGNESKVSDATLPTTGYVDKEIEALDDHFLIKDENGHQSVGGSVGFDGDVTVYGKHTVENDAEIKGDATIGNTLHLQGDMKTDTFNDAAGQITGAQLTQAGILTVAGLKATSFEVFELIYNKIRAVDGKMSLSSTGIVERVEYVLLDQSVITPEEFYTYGSGYKIADIDYIYLTFKEDDFNKGILPFTHCDILYGYVNQIAESGQYARGGQSCMYVLSTNEEIGDANAEQNGQRKMTIKVKLFAEPSTDENGKFLYDSDNQVVGNIPPTEGMTLAHRGNTRGDIYRDRTTSFFIDSMSGNIIMLQNVTTPRIHKGYYGASLGTLPTDMYESVKGKFLFLQPHDPVIYAKYGIFENLLEYDHEGQPIKREVYRGYWSQSIANGTEEGEEQYRSTSLLYHTVTHNGSLWKCNMDMTTVEPREGIAEWMMLVSKGADSAVSNYDILPSVSSIYFDADKNRMSVDKVDVVIGEANAYGYARINDQEILDDKGLTVLYSIDNGALVPFSISDSGALALEDGSGVIALEGGGGIWLEGSDIDSSLINNDITLYLVRDYGLDTETIMSLYVIPVVKAGSFKSTVFSRSKDIFAEGYKPEGGTYAEPFPMKDGVRDPLWSDGIPEGVGPIYSSYATFYGNGKNSGWSTPVKVEDTVDFEVMYSPVAFASISEAKKALIIEGTPFNKVGEDIDGDWLEKANENGWYDDDKFADDSQFKVVWMATNHKSVGSEWSDTGWVVTKTEGEKGEKGDKGEDAIATEYNIIKNSAFDNFESFRDGGVTKYNIPDWDTSVLSNSNYSANAVNGQPSILIYGSLSQSIPSLVGGKEYVLSFWYKAGTSSNPTVIIVSSSLPEGSVMPLGETTGSTISYNSNVCTINLPVVSDYTKAVFKIKSTSYGSGFSIIWDTDTTGGPSSSMYLSQPKLEMGSVATQYTKAVSELVGPAGEAGPMAYPEGEWSSGITYTRNKDSVPIVYYDDKTSDEVEGMYYILKTDSVKSDTPPSEDGTNWRPMTKWEFVYINFLMANWALFGGANGGVFYNGHLFSQDGVDSNGASKYGDHKSDMWNGNALSGAFQPNLFLDFLRGVVKSNKLSETFMEFDYNKVYNILNMDESYNVSITPTRDSYNENIGRLLSMPLVNNIYNGDEIIVSKAPWQPDGMKSTILVRESDSWNKVVQLAEGGIYGSYPVHGVSEYDFKNCLTSGVVLCADSRVINQYSYRLSNTSNDVKFNPGQYNSNGESLDTAQYGGFFVVKGRLSKFLFVEPGMMVRLRSCSTSLGIRGASTDTNKLQLWYVENSDDFEEIPATVTVYISHFYENGKMNKVSDNFDIYDDIGKPFGYGYYDVGTQGTGISFKNYSFATRGIATVDKLMREKEPLVYDSNINIYTNKNGHSSLDEEANVIKIQQTEKH